MALGARKLPSVYSDPPWLAPLDAEAAILAVPENATMTGVFLAAVRDVARSRGIPVASARERYTPFSPYPLREHCRLLVDVGRAVFPRTRLRDALRRMGRGAPSTLTSSLVGRVMLGSVEGPFAMLSAMCKSYMVHMKPCELEVVELDAQSAVVRMASIYNFLDSHNVGVFEGVLHHAGVQGRVRITAYSPTEADLLCEWE